MAARKPQGHPAKQDPDIAKLFKAMRSTVDLVRDIGPRLSEDSEVHLRATALGLLIVYAELTGQPSPIQGDQQ